MFWPPEMAAGIVQRGNTFHSGPTLCVQGGKREKQFRCFLPNSETWFAVPIGVARFSPTSINKIMITWSFVIFLGGSVPPGVHTLFQSKKANFIPYFRPRMLENDILWGGAYPICLIYGSTPHPPGNFLTPTTREIPQALHDKTTNWEKYCSPGQTAKQWYNLARPRAYHWTFTVSVHSRLSEGTDSLIASQVRVEAKRGWYLFFGFTSGRNAGNTPHSAPKVFDMFLTQEETEKSVLNFRQRMHDANKHAFYVLSFSQTHPQDIVHLTRSGLLTGSSQWFFVW